MHNTVLITSALYTNYGIYSTAERIAQTLATVISARTHIPNATIILIDNSKVDIQADNSPELNALIDAVDFYIDNSDDTDIQHFHNSVTNYDIGKNAMECLGMYKALNYILTDPAIMEIVVQSSRIYKLSGRYEITDQFNLMHFDSAVTRDKYVFKQAQPGWVAGEPLLLQTRLWSFTPSLLLDTVKLFKTIIDNMFATFNQGKYIDVEHSMAKFIPADKLVQFNTIGLKGNIAPNGVEVID